MGKFYVLQTSFSPNTASTNRLLGFLKTLSRKGIDTEVVFFMSDRNNSEAPELPHIRYNYYWKKFNVRNERIKTLLYVFVYAKKFLKYVKPGDTVYLYGCNELVADLVSLKM